MARARSFDEAEVLGAAMHAFRRDGYAGVSIKQLAKATGLTSGSLYNAYGDKEGLFQAAMAHYVDGFVAERIRGHTGPHATLDDLEDYFRSLLHAPLNDGFGCLVTNSAVEFGSSASIADGCIQRALEVIADGIRSMLERELGPDKARSATHHLMLLSQGILVLVRGRGMGAADMESVIRIQFDGLRAARAAFMAKRKNDEFQEERG